jgi:tRNA-modifying protein YgfZ
MSDMTTSDSYRALRAAAGVLDRADRGRLALSGADRRGYLQGILTNDIAALAPGTGCYAAYLTPQGRMVTDLRVFELGDRILVDLDASLAASIADRWSMFVITEDVTVEDVSASTAQVGVYGPSAAAVLRQALEAGRAPDESVPDAGTLEAIPLHGNARWDFGGEPAFVLRSDDIGVQGFDVVLAAGRKDALLAQLLAAGGVLVADADAEVTRVEAGRPKFLVDMTEDTIPLEAGIEDRAISLTKGCYVGQEIIIRVLHRGGGRVAKRLVGLSFDAGQPAPPAGARIMAGEKEIGTITSATDSPALGHAIALGYVHRDFVEPATAVVAGDAPARVAALPFVPAGG